MRAGRVATAAGLVLVLAVGGCVADGAGRAPGGFSAGAAGIGDPYFPDYGNGGYDVASYDLNVRYDPGSHQLTGTATITATATGDLSRFDLDLAGMTVDSVAVNGVPAGNRRDRNELVIMPKSGLPKGAPFTTEVHYAGVPQPINSPQLGMNGFFSTADGAVAIGEPESASTWFPVNDHPSDKATYRVEVTVPAGVTALSNGVPGGSRTSDGWTTWVWSEASPMASYLSTLVIGDYRVKTATHAGKPMVTAVAASLPADGPAERSIARTAEITDFLATQFGPYPFDAYGGIVINDDRIRYALETQSRPVYSNAFFARGVNEEVVAHELAHQWFGDSVSVSRWSEIWLNEGLATYAEWLWTEHAGGQSVQRSFTDQYGRTDWSKPAANPGRTDLFGTAVYKRGALAVHALRLTVGDSVFFKILQTWTAEKRDGNGSTADFVSVAERVSGASLRPLFDAWLAGTTAPPVPKG